MSLNPEQHRRLSDAAATLTRPLLARFPKCMVIQRTRMPAWRLLMFETLHVALDDEETGCGLTMQPLLRVTGAFAEDFWTGDYEAPVAGACRRCAAAMRWFAREFRRDCEVRHPRTQEHWDNCWCGQFANGA